MLVVVVLQKASRTNLLAAVVDVGLLVALHFLHLLFLGVLVMSQLVLVVVLLRSVQRSLLLVLL